MQIMAELEEQARNDSITVSKAERKRRLHDSVTPDKLADQLLQLTGAGIDIANLPGASTSLLSQETTQEPEASVKIPELQQAPESKNRVSVEISASTSTNSVLANTPIPEITTKPADTAPAPQQVVRTDSKQDQEDSVTRCTESMPPNQEVVSSPSPKNTSIKPKMENKLQSHKPEELVTPNFSVGAQQEPLHAAVEEKQPITFEATMQATEEQKQQVTPQLKQASEQPILEEPNQAKEQRQQAILDEPNKANSEDQKLTEEPKQITATIESKQQTSQEEPKQQHTLLKETKLPESKQGTEEITQRAIPEETTQCEAEPKQKPTSEEPKQEPKQEDPKQEDPKQDIEQKKEVEEAKPETDSIEKSTLDSADSQEKPSKTHKKSSHSHHKKAKHHHSKSSSSSSLRTSENSDTISDSTSDHVDTQVALSAPEASLQDETTSSQASVVMDSTITDQHSNIQNANCPTKSQVIDVIEPIASKSDTPVAVKSGECTVPTENSKNVNAAELKVEVSLISAGKPTLEAELQVKQNRDIVQPEPLRKLEAQITPTSSEEKPLLVGNTDSNMKKEPKGDVEYKEKPEQQPIKQETTKVRNSNELSAKPENKAESTLEPKKQEDNHMSKPDEKIDVVILKESPKSKDAEQIPAHTPTSEKSSCPSSANNDRQQPKQAPVAPPKPVILPKSTTPPVKSEPKTTVAPSSSPKPIQKPQPQLPPKTSANSPPIVKDHIQPTPGQKPATCPLPAKPVPTQAQTSKPTAPPKPVSLSPTPNTTPAPSQPPAQPQPHPHSQSIQPQSTQQVNTPASPATPQQTRGPSTSQPPHQQQTDVASRPPSKSIGSVNRPLPPPRSGTTAVTNSPAPVAKPLPTPGIPASSLASSNGQAGRLNPQLMRAFSDATIRMYPGH